MVIDSAERQAVFEKLVAYFSRHYDLYEWGGVRYPVVVFRPDAAQQDDVDSVLGTLLPEYEERSSFTFYNTAHLNAMQASGRRLENKATFSFVRLETGPLKVHARLGRYFDMMATCDAMDIELREYLKQNNMSGEIDHQLPLRARLHQVIPPQQALFDGAGRSATIGVATLIVFNHAGTYKAILAQRSSTTATDPLFYHVQPAFVFQPSEEAVFNPDNWRVSRHIYREFLEELLGVPEMDGVGEVDSIYEHPQIQFLRQPGQASLHLTGVTINLLTLRPEIMALLLIHNPEWYDRISAGTGLRSAWETEKRTTRFVPIASDDLLLSSLPHSMNGVLYANMTPQGAAALWSGVERARAILGYSAPHTA